MYSYKILASVSAIMVLAIACFPGTVSAELSKVTLIPLNEKISLEKTVIPMHIPLDNTHPWGAVTDKATAHVEGYPVIIQFFQDGLMVHAAQVTPSSDGSYEYQFRVRNFNSVTSEYVNLFSGDYAVHIFRVVPNLNSMV